jgi:hypothetical protein
MESYLKHRTSEYFNSEDLFLLKTPLDKYYVTKLHNYNGNWYSNEGLKIKVSSIKTINCVELYHKQVNYNTTEVKGIITKFIEPNGIGVSWNSGITIKKYGLPSFWNNPSKLV